MPDTILEGDHPTIISAKFGWDWLSSFRGEDLFKISSPLFSIFSLVAILVGSRDHRTQIWKGAIQGPFHQSLVAIGPVVSEEKIKMWNIDGQTKSDDNSSHGLKARWAKNQAIIFQFARFSNVCENVPYLLVQPLNTGKALIFQQYH